MYSLKGIMDKLFIFAETQRQAMDYARKNKFRPGYFDVLPRPDSLRAYKRPVSVLLVGRVERRDDYEDLMRILEEVEARVNRIAVSLD